MTGVSFKVETKDTVSPALAKKLAKVENLGDFHKLVGEHMLTSVEDNFDSETAPDGSRWQHHAPATVASRLRRNGNAPLTILRESGALAGSFNYSANTSQVEIGTPSVYGAIHHFGGKAGRGKSVTIPARPILGVSSKDETAIGEIAEDFLRN